MVLVRSVSFIFVAFILSFEWRKIVVCCLPLDRLIRLRACRSFIVKQGPACDPSGGCLGLCSGCWAVKRRTTNIWRKGCFYSRHSHWLLIYTSQMEMILRPARATGWWRRRREKLLYLFHCIDDSRLEAYCMGGMFGWGTSLNCTKLGCMVWPNLMKAPRLPIWSQ